ncbi:MAG: ATP-binding protein, partial [Malacoplasma sp.]|nr:ATP-binding protein [Malacoplasma sp.]
ETCFEAIRSIKNHENSLINNNSVGKKFLPVICFYGPNGGGKTAILLALLTFQKIVLNNFIFGQEILNFFDQNKPLFFEIIFIKNDIFYKYSISIKNNYEIINESFSYSKYKPKNKQIILFDRKKDILNIKEFGIQHISEINTIPTASLFSFLSRIVKNIHLKNFNELLNSINVIDFTKMVFNNFLFWDKWTKKYMDDNKAKLLKYFKDLNFNILGYEFRKINPLINDYEFASLFLEKEDSNFSSKKGFNIVLESRGTQKIITFISNIDNILENGGYLFVDELDASLHTDLLRYIIKLFTNKNTNKKGAVLFFNSHDMATLDKSVFRKDEIYFSNLNESHVGFISRLSDFKARDNNSWNKMYSEGKFGADPY